MSNVHEKELEADLKSSVAKLLSENQGMTPTEAFTRVTKDMLKNNPFVAPESGCPINDLPNELLAHIFYVGMTIEGEEEENPSEDDLEEDELDILDWDSDDEEDGIPLRKKASDSVSKQKEADNESESEDEPSLPFQVLVSHVCKHWREVAIDSPLLWTRLEFELGTSLDMAKIWLERSKGHPLEIEIDCTTLSDWGDEIDEDQIDVSSTVAVALGPNPDPESIPENGSISNNQPPYLTKAQVSDILDIVVPAVDRWRVFAVNASFYDSLHLILERLSKCPSALLLESLEMCHHEDCEEFNIFNPPELNTRFLLFGGVAPELKSIMLWGVHLDWEASLSFLNNLRILEFAFHADDVRPSFQTFSDILAASPDLDVLSLSLSGPAGKKEDWGTTPIDIPSVKTLTLCYHDPPYIEDLLPLLYVPNVVELVINYDSQDYTQLALLLARPAPGRTKSLLAGLEHLRLDGLPSNRRSRQLMLEQLVNLKAFRLNCVGDEDEFFTRLMELTSEPGATQKVRFCPHLETLMTTGINGLNMKKMVEARKQGGVPLSKVMMSEEDDLEEKEETWLRDHLEELDFFEPSDSEEEIEIDVDTEDEMDID